MWNGWRCYAEHGVGTGILAAPNPSSGSATGTLQVTIRLRGRMTRFSRAKGSSLTVIRGAMTHLFGIEKCRRLVARSWHDT